MKKKNKGTEINLFIGLGWLICGMLLTVLEPKNMFFTLFLGVGIFYTTYTLKKTQILL